jgi:hypothetical protein
MSPDVRVAFGPSRVYAELVRHTDSGRLLAIRRPALVAVILASSLGIMATGRLDVSLVASLLICWSFAPVLQLLAARLILLSTPGRTVGVARAIDLLFMGHVPWSLWLVALAGLAALGLDSDVLRVGAMVSAPVIAVWTASLIRAFCLKVLRTSPHDAVIRTLLHQALIWTVTGVYIAVAVQVWPRLLANIVAR